MTTGRSKSSLLSPFIGTRGVLGKIPGVALERKAAIEGVVANTAEAKFGKKGAAGRGPGCICGSRSSCWSGVSP